MLLLPALKQGPLQVHELYSRRKYDRRSVELTVIRDSQTPKLRLIPVLPRFFSLDGFELSWWCQEKACTMSTHFIANSIKIQTMPSPLWNSHTPHMFSMPQSLPWTINMFIIMWFPPPTTITHPQDFHLCFSSNKCWEDSRARTMRGKLRKLQ